MIKYKCPKCGAEMINICYATNPPIPALMCSSCCFECKEKDYEGILQNYIDNLHNKNRKLGSLIEQEKREKYGK